jgi:iron complex transport system ATP-binding protein
MSGERGLVGRNISFARGGRLILQSVSVSAQRGEFIAVLGPNGAGKSTLLSVLAGLLRPDSGDVRLDGRPLDAIAARELALRRAFLPQNPRCDWPIPVERLVALGLTPSLPAFGGFNASDTARIEAALQACDLLAHRRQSATTLSGGELARAMLARALVGDPDLLIIDEPLAGLDPRHALDAAQRLGRLARERGKLVIAAVHDLNLALRHATRIWALRDGRLLADGPPATTLDAALLRDVYDVTGSVAGEGAGAYVDYA